MKGRETPDLDVCSEKTNCLVIAVRETGKYSEHLHTIDYKNLGSSYNYSVCYKTEFLSRPV